MNSIPVQLLTQVIFQFNSKFNPEVYTIQYEFHINVLNSKQFHVGKSYTMYFSTIIGVSSFIFFLVYLAFTHVYDELAGMHKLTQFWNWIAL